MRKLNNAFTLTELLVALGVIGILCAILLPVIFNLLPNQNTIMAKRAYYAAQTVVADLINSEACYPDKTSAVNGKRIGFDDEYGYPNCTLYGADNASLIEDGGEAVTKFKTLFEDKLGVLPTSNVPSDKFTTTNDGMEWSFTSAAFSHSGNGGSILLAVDVNGSDKPNCGNGKNYATELGNGGTDCTTRTAGFDRFQMRIYGNGKMEILDDWAKDAVKVNKDITEE